MATVQDVLARLKGVTQTGEAQWQSLCPAHKDDKPSLSIGVGKDGKVLLNCHVGCKYHDVAYAIDYLRSDLFPDPERKSWDSRITQAYDYHDAAGNLAYQVVRLRDPKDFRQRRPDGSGGWIWKMTGIKRHLYRLPEIIACNGQPLLVVEGEKDADNLRALGFVATCNPGGAGKWKSQYNDSLAGKNVVSIPDFDAANAKTGRRPGTDHSLLVANELNDKAASVKIVELPDINEGQDISDWLANGGTADALRNIIDATPEWTMESKLKRFANLPIKPIADQVAEQAGGRKQIESTLDEHIENRESLEGLSTDADLYCRGSDLVMVNIDATTGEDVPRIMRLSRPTVRDRLSATCYYWHEKKTETGVYEVQDPVPGTAVDAIYQRGYFGDYFRTLRGVATNQFLRPDGSLVTEPGYDHDTGFLYFPIAEQAAIPDNPTRDDALAAVETLLDVIKDFPMDKPEDGSAWLALLLTIVGRTTFAGPAPMTLIDANTRGAGKGLLADVTSLIALGRPASITSPPEDDAEFRKRITTLVMSGDPLILIDNVAGMLGCASLDAALTATVWKDRILGKNEQCELPMLATWMATGNNVQLRADTARRIMQIRLVSPEERPEERDDFAHRDLKQFVRDNRSRLYGAALTILRAWFVAGKPTHRLTTWGSYEAWSGVVRESLAYCLMPDPALTRDRLIEASDSEAGALAELIGAWPELAYYMDNDPGSVCSVTTREIIEAIKQAPDKLSNMVSAVESITNKPLAKVTAGVLGQRLKKYKMRVVGGKRIINTKGGKNQNEWRVDCVQG